MLELGAQGEPSGARIRPHERAMQYFRARIASWESSMTEPHQPLTCGKLLLDPILYIAARLRVIEHVERRTGGASHAKGR